MTDRDSNGWLEAVLVDAQEAGWCMNSYCTTCGCLEFRQAFWAAAARQAGIADRFESGLGRDILGSVSDADREVLVRTLVSGLRELSPMWGASEAFRTIILDLDPPFIRHGVPVSLDDELSATPAGEALACMRSYAEESRAERAQQLAYNSPQEVEERRRVKREKREIAHARRLAEALLRNAERLALLATLARLSPVERLYQFATDSTLILDSVSTEMIPTQESDLIDLDNTTAVALLERIGHRKGAWGRLRRMLERRVKNDG